MNVTIEQTNHLLDPWLPAGCLWWILVCVCGFTCKIACGCVSMWLKDSQAHTEHHQTAELFHSIFGDALKKNAAIYSTTSALIYTL